MIIDINKIIIKSDRIRKDFGDIQELADDIKQNGLINPPVVNRDYVLLAGERRLKACKSLGWSQIEVRMMDTRDAEHELNVEISENDVRKGFTKSERVDYMKRLLRIESAKAKERQGERTSAENNTEVHRSDEATAKQFDISASTMRKEISIVENKDMLTPEDFADWDEGRLSTNKAFQKIKAELAERDKEIEELRNNHSASQREKFEKNRADRLQDEVNLLKDKVADYESRPAETKIVEKIPDDYEDLKKEAEGYKKDYKAIEKDFREKTIELQEMRKKLQTIEDASPEKQYSEKLKDSCLMFCSKVSDFIEKVGGYVWLTEHINELPNLQREGYIKAVHAIKSWADTMDFNINNKIKEIM